MGRKLRFINEYAIVFKTGTFRLNHLIGLFSLFWQHTFFSKNIFWLNNQFVDKLHFLHHSHTYHKGICIWYTHRSI